MPHRCERLQTPSTSHVNETTGVLQGYSDATGASTSGFCTTNVCHDSDATDGRWNEPAIDCDACHYWEASPSDTANTAHSRTISELSHNGHLDTGNGRSFVCVDCHTDNGSDASPLTHVTSGSGGDSVYYLGRAVATQDEATIDTTGTWITASAWNDTTNTCTNVCHDPSGVSYAGSGVWGNANAGCVMCHSDTDPGTGSHTEHVSIAGTFGINPIDCNSCHPDNGTLYGHMDEAVDVSVTAPGYAGTLTAPWGTTFGTCTTSDCHNEGTGSAVETPVWGTASADCSICHAAAPATLSHGVHLGATGSFGVVVDCTDCHDAASAISMLGKTTHIDSTVTMADKASAYDGTVTVGDGGLYGSCLTNVCHNDGVGAAPRTSYTWGDVITNCEECHGDTAVNPPTLSHDVHLNASGSFGVTISCVDCHTGETLVSHMNGSVSLTNKASGYDTTVVVGDGTYGSCGTNDCHNDGKDQAPDTTPYNWGDVISNCTECHSDTDPGTGSHTRHLTTGTSGGFACVTCHDLATDVGYRYLRYEPVPQRW